jgi:hypothetical protein
MTIKKDWLQLLVGIFLWQLLRSWRIKKMSLGKIVKKINVKAV